jgi:hypothetical protein
METKTLLDYIPAVVVLISIMTITLYILSRFGDKIFDKDYKATNVLLVVASFLFLTILVVHLFKEQSWTADTLKILIGALVGAGSSKLGEKKDSAGSSVDVSGQAKIEGDVAGRDINKNIQNIKDSISQIKDSVINQNNQIKQIIGDSGDFDYLINTVYERGDAIPSAIKRVIDYWQPKGWTLKHFSSDYHGMDGIFLIFVRHKSGEETTVHYIHSADVRRFPTDL